MSQYVTRKDLTKDRLLVLQETLDDLRHHTTEGGLDKDGMRINRDQRSLGFVGAHSPWRWDAPRELGFTRNPSAPLNLTHPGLEPFLDMPE